MLNLNYWRQHFDLHSVLTQILPLIDKHPILQRIQWEIQQGDRISDFVRNCKTTQRSLAGKFAQMEKGKGADNYMAFKNKFSRDKLDRMVDMAQRCKVDIQQEIVDLQQWANEHDRYLQMEEDQTLWLQGYEKVKTIQRNIFQSPIEFQNLYFEIERRLAIAEEIRQDLKRVYEEAQRSEKRIRHSRV